MGKTFKDKKPANGEKHKKIHKVDSHKENHKHIRYDENDDFSEINDRLK